MKLSYFAVRGRAEPARIMLEMSGVPFEYEGVSLERWKGAEGKAAMAAITPLAQLPVLVDGSLVLCQSQAINRYLARKFGFYGDTIEEQARVDEVAETAQELAFDTSSLHWNARFDEARAEHRVAYAKKLESLSAYFERTRADAEHWVLAGRYTMADVMMSCMLEMLLLLHPGLVEGFPSLHHAMTAFFTTGRVRDYVTSDRRPLTWTVPMAKFAGTPEETHHWTGAPAS